MSLAHAIEQGDNEAVLNLTEKLLLEAPSEDTRAFLQHSKLVALIHLDRFDQAQTYFKSLDPKQRSFPDYSLIASYLLYKSEKYEETAAELKRSKFDSLPVGQRLLLGQAETKAEHFLDGFKIFWGLYKDNRVSGHLLEDVVINAINCLIVLMLSEEPHSLFHDDHTLRMAADLLAILVEKPGAFPSREAQINTLLLFIVIEKVKPDKLYQIYKRSAFDFQEQSRRMLDNIASLLNEETGAARAGQADDFFLKLQGDQLIDQLTLFSLRTFVMQKNQEISWSKTEIQAIEHLLFESKGKVTDEQLRISLLSFLSFIYSVSESENAARVSQLLGKIDDELRSLSRNSRRSQFLQKHLLLNKIVLLLHNNNVAEARRVAKNDLRINDKLVNYQVLPIETQMIIANKNQKELDTKLAAFEPERMAQDPQLACVYYLVQLAVYYAWNNQKRYSDVFGEFVREFFIRQLGLDPSKRFLTPSVFTQFSKNMVFYMIRNNTLMKGLEDKITNFIDYIGDSAVVLKMANYFVERKNFGVAEKILRDLSAKDPTNQRVRSRLNYVYSVTNPHNIDESVLPQFEVIKDLNTLRNLENDFLAVIRTKGAARGDVGAKKADDTKMKVEKSSKKKIQKKYRIRWPKDFDFEKPGMRPDPERWLPKYERKKFLRRAIKEGKLTKTQGVTHTGGQSKELFRAEHSTAAQQVVKNKNKKR